MPIASELTIDTAASASAMANEIFGAGVTNINSASYSGDALASGIFSGGDAIAPGVTPADTGVILSTGQAQGVTQNSGTTNTNVSTGQTTSITGGITGDSDFDTLAGATTYDASFLEVNFTPTGNLLTMDFIIASEEYPEYINSNFLDVVGVWVNGVEATVSVGDGSASVGNINGATTPNIYNDNTSDQFNTEMDGFTITLSFTAPVNMGAENTLKIGIADVTDSNYDSNLLIAGSSVQTALVAVDDQIVMGHNDTDVLDVLDNDSNGAGGTMTVTQINGQDVVANDTVILGTGQEVTLNPDGTFTILGDADAETVYFTYAVEDGLGNVDTGLVEVEQVPCFVAGSLIDTARGPVPVEQIVAGDLVITEDYGALPVRWVGQRNAEATGKQAPILIRKGSFGATTDVWLSPQHRVLVRDVWAELLFGESEVLVKAKDLVNDKTVRVDAFQGEVTYVHLLFDGHQIVTCSGLASESYLPGPMTVRGFDPTLQNEILTMFPELTEATKPLWDSARPALRKHEALALTQSIAA